MSDCCVPVNLEELAGALGRMTPKSKVLAGGTDLIVKMRTRGLDPDFLVVLDQVKEMREIRVTEEEAVIGAMATMKEIHEALAGYPDLRALSDAAGGVGSPQIRCKATIGGNVANASPAADTPPALWVLGASVTLMNSKGDLRTISMREFNGERPEDSAAVQKVAYGSTQAKSGGRKTDLKPDEVIVHFQVDRTKLKGWQSAFVKLGSRAYVSISRIGIATAMKIGADGVIEDIHLCAGAIKPIPFELREAEREMIGKRLDLSYAELIGNTFKGNTRRKYKEDAARGVAQDLLIRLLKN